MKVAMPLAKNALAPLVLTVLCLQSMEVFKKRYMVRKLN